MSIADERCSASRRPSPRSGRGPHLNETPAVVDDDPDAASRRAWRGGESCPRTDSQHARSRSRMPPTPRAEDPPPSARPSSVPSSQVRIASRTRCSESSSLRTVRSSGRGATGRNRAARIATSSARSSPATSCSSTCSSTRSASFGAAPDGLDEAVDPLVDRAPTALDEPVRVEDDDAAGRQLDDALPVLRAEACPERKPAAAPPAPRRGRPGTRRPAADGRPTRSGGRPRRDRRSRTPPSRTMCPARRLRAGRACASAVGGLSRSMRDRTERVSQLPHARRGVNALPDDVSDDEPDAALGELDGVEPVASDVDLLRTRQVARGDLRACQPRESHRQDAPLEGLGDRPLGLEVARAVESLCALARRASRGRRDRPRSERDRLGPAELESSHAPPCGDERDDEEAVRSRRPGPSAGASLHHAPRRTTCASGDPSSSASFCRSPRPGGTPCAGEAARDLVAPR